MKKTFVFIYLVILVIVSVGFTTYFLYDIFANSNKVLTIELEDNQSSDIKLSIKDFYPSFVFTIVVLEVFFIIH